MPRKIDHHLEMHGGQLRVRKEIPKTLRPAFGDRAMLVESLGTTDYRKARVLRDVVLPRFNLEIARARNPDDPILGQARMLRRWEENRKSALPRPDAGDDAAAEAMMLDSFADLADEHGFEAAQRFLDVATGRTTPLTDHLDEWLNVRPRPLKSSTEYQYRRAFKLLGDWCKQRRIAQTLQAIDRRAAMQFRDQCLSSIGARKTINVYLTAYRSYWQWLLDRNRIEANPWMRTNIKDADMPREPGDDGARSFTDAEVVTLLSDDCPQPIADLMRVAALTGARIEAICQLRVKDCQANALTFKPQKRETTTRKVPIHRDLKAIVARRTKGKRPDDWLFHELLDVAGKKSASRSAAVSKRFGRYRRDVGVDERPNGKRRSNVTFHSFRNWFITKAQNAGQPEHIVAAVVGHKHPTMTFGHYAGDLLWDQRRACVDAVKLPPLPKRTTVRPMRPPPRKKARTQEPGRSRER